jgi:hypothetical protein
MEWMKEYRSVEPMNDERSVKMTDKRVAWCKAELANAKTAEGSEAAAEVAEAAATEVAEAATAEVAEATTAEVAEATTAEAMATTTKTHQRCCRKVR